MTKLIIDIRDDGSFQLNMDYFGYLDGLRMTSDQIDKVIRSYLDLGPHGRRTDPRIGQDRQALIMSGAAILQTLMRCWPTDRLSVADRGLREGLLYAQMSADGVLEDAPY